jgi:hypothetical protein
MEPIYIILYVVIVTLVLTLVFPRIRQVSPTLRRLLWIAVIVGGTALLAVTYLAFIR